MKDLRGKKLIETEFSKEMTDLLKKHPYLKPQIYQLYVIAEAYPRSLVRETFMVLQSLNDKHLAIKTLSILCDMAVIPNDQGLYLTFIRLLKRANKKIRKEMVRDERFKFTSDSEISKALSEYESKIKKLSS